MCLSLWNIINGKTVKETEFRDKHNGFYFFFIFFLEINKYNGFEEGAWEGGST
jgi:hypothetical protein